jgi:hypothetical protein
MSEAPLNSDSQLDPLERQLRGLTPRPAAIDRDQLMFASGRAAAGRSLTVWRCATAASLCLALGLGTFAGLQQANERIVEQIVYLPAPTPAAPREPAPFEETAPPSTSPSSPAPSTQLADAAWSLRRRVLTEGVDALPPPPPVPMRAGQSLRDLTN